MRRQCQTVKPHFSKGWSWFDEFRKLQVQVTQSQVQVQVPGPQVQVQVRVLGLEVRVEVQVTKNWTRVGLEFKYLTRVLQHC
jgi:hypothetical protein